MKDPEEQGSPLYWAAFYGHTHFIAPLIAAGVEINKPDGIGRTPVYIAACNGYIDAIHALHASRASLSKPNRYGKTPVYIAVEKGHASIISVPHALGANVNTPMNDGATPLYIAAQSDDYLQKFSTVINGQDDCWIEQNNHQGLPKGIQALKNVPLVH